MDIRETFYKNKKDLSFLLLSIALLIISSFVPVNVFLYVIPLMIVLENKTINKKVLFLSVLYIYLIISFIISYFAIPSDQRLKMLGVNLVGIFVPLSMLIATTVWVFLDTKRLRLRYLASLVVPSLLALLLLVYLSSDTEGGNTFKTLVTKAVELTSTSVFNNTDQITDVSKLTSVVLNGIANTTLLFLAIVIGLTEYLALYLRNKNNKQWQLSITQWDLNINYLYVLLVLWSMALATFVIKLPNVLELVIINIALEYTLLYFVIGLSILAFLLTKNNPRARASKVFLLVCLFILIPPANAVIALILTLLGAADTWIAVRERRKEI